MGSHQYMKQETKFRVTHESPLSAGATLLPIQAVVNVNSHRQTNVEWVNSNTFFFKRKGGTRMFCSSEANIPDAVGFPLQSSQPATQTDHHGIFRHFHSLFEFIPSFFRASVVLCLFGQSFKEVQLVGTYISHWVNYTKVQIENTQRQCSPCVHPYNFLILSREGWPHGVSGAV